MRVGCYCAMGRVWLGVTDSGGNNGGENGGYGGIEAPFPLGSRCLDLIESNSNPIYGEEGTSENENIYCAP